jgi:hypothetical protein
MSITARIAISAIRMAGDRDWIVLLSLLMAFSALLPGALRAQESAERRTFRIKYVAEGSVYLEGGSAAGLKVGQELRVLRAENSTPADANESVPLSANPIATLTVLSVAASSAVCEIKDQTVPPEVGDVARLGPDEVREEMKEQREERMDGGRDYAQVVTFNTVDPVEEEVRASVPRPPSPEINRMRGRIGFEYDTVLSHTTPSSTSSALGMVARVDMTRLFGTYWNFNGYWRGRFTSLSGSAQPTTITDLINRTYHLAITYDNPHSRWVAGAGRLYLPWATSLDTIDGGYFGRRTGDIATVGLFGGSTPDPASYDYNPNQKIGGAFLNLEGGDFQQSRYSTTFGLALTAQNWIATRQFLFNETTITLRKNFSIYYSMEMDFPHTVVTDPGNPTANPPIPPTTTGTGGLNRSYLTLRFQVHPRVELNLTDTYYKNLPTFDPQLIGTGLLDRYLFQGLSWGARVQLPKKMSVYADLGQSSRTGDKSSSWNQMYGMSFGSLGKTGFIADFHYSKFSSPFGSGTYEAGSLSHSLGDRLHLNIQGGIQNLNSTMTTTGMTHFMTSYLDWMPAKNLFFEVGYTWQRGGTMNYDQMIFMVGKRF